MTDPQLDRRTLLKAAGATAGSLSLAGCLDGLVDDSPEEVVLDEPDDYDQLRDARENGEITHPIYGDELPEVSAPCAIQDTDVTTTDFMGDRHSIYTFIFARCPGACPVLMANVAQVQVNALKNGYGSEIAALPVTFDPENDTPDVLTTYSEERGAAVDDGSWYFLRPETTADAESFVMDAFGVHYEPLTDDDREAMDMHPDMAYMHDEVIIVANADGYVERTYFGEDTTNTGAIVDDVDTLVDRW